MALIEYRSIDIRQEGNLVLENVNFEIEAGEFVYLVGKVGSGKTSLLKTIYGELPLFATRQDGEAEPVEPKAIVLDYDMMKIRHSRVQELRRQMGIVFQDFQLLTDRNVHNNLDFVLRATGWKKKDDRDRRIYEVLTMVGMPQAADAMPYELSGGEQQCVCTARALLNEPKLILADEATGNLDAQTGHHTASLIYNICKEHGTAVLMSTHNENLIQDFPGRVLRCNKGRLAEE